MGQFRVVITVLARGYFSITDMMRERGVYESYCC